MYRPTLDHSGNDRRAAMNRFELTEFGKSGRSQGEIGMIMGSYIKWVEEGDDVMVVLLMAAKAELDYGRLRFQEAGKGRFTWQGCGKMFERKGTVG